MRCLTKQLLGTAIAASLATAASAQIPPTPPVALQKPHTVKGPAERNDPYYWLRDDSRKNPEMLAYLTAENAYADAWMAPLRPLQDRLYGEIVGRIKQDDSSVPVFDNGYFYYTRYEAGKDYPITARRKRSMAAREEIIFDQPAMAKPYGFFQLADYEVSPDNRLAAFAVDTVGRRQNVLRFKNLETGEMLADEIANVESDFHSLSERRTTPRRVAAARSLAYLAACVWRILFSDTL